MEQKSLEVVQGQVGREGVAQSLHLQPHHTERPGNGGKCSYDRKMREDRGRPMEA